MCEGCGITMKIHVKEGAEIILQALFIPFALQWRIEEELERLQKGIIMESVKFFKLLPPGVPGVKQDGSLRFCVDYKVTVNSAPNTEYYPLHCIDDLHAFLAGRRHAYLHPLFRGGFQEVSYNLYLTRGFSYIIDCPCCLAEDNREDPWKGSKASVRYQLFWVSGSRSQRSGQIVLHICTQTWVEILKAVL